MFLWDDVGNVWALGFKSQELKVACSWAGLIWAAAKGNRVGDWAAPREVSSQMGHWIPD